MPIDRGRIGREYPSPTPFEVGREHVRSFARAMDDPTAAYLDPEAARALGHPDAVAPPTFLTVLGFRDAGSGPLADPGLGLDWSRVVHGEQAFALSRPVVVGDVLHSVQRVADVRTVGRNEVLVLVTSVTDASGEPVAELTSTLVSRGTAPPRAGS